MPDYPNTKHGRAEAFLFLLADLVDKFHGGHQKSWTPRLLGIKLAKRLGMTQSSAIEKVRRSFRLLNHQHPRWDTFPPDEDALDTRFQSFTYRTCEDKLRMLDDKSAKEWAQRLWSDA